LPQELHAFSPHCLVVTGGAGFIGSNFIQYALDQGGDERIINVDSLTYAGNLENLTAVNDHPRYVFERADICATETMIEIFRRYSADAIINFAAESHVDRSITGPRVFVRTNVEGTLSLLQAARECGVKRFLQVGTDEVYGSLGPTGYFTENTPLAPRSPYSASKAAADHLVAAYAHTHGLDTVITRCSNNYGPYQFPEKMIPLMINNARQHKPLPVYGDGLHVRDWLHVSDHCAALWAALTRAKPGSVFNIGGNNEQTNLDVVKTILRHLDLPEKLITFVKDRPGHDRRYAIDASRIRDELGWTPKMDFDTGLKQTIQWYLENRAWLDHVVSGEYQTYYESMYAGR